MTARPQRGRTMLVRYDLAEVEKHVFGVFLQLFDLAEVILSRLIVYKKTLKSL